MSVNKYVNGKLLQVSGNADTRLTLDDISTILGYTPVNPNIIGTELATLNSSGKLEDSQKPSYSWSEITGKPSTFTPSSHTHSYAGSSSAGGAATSALTLTTARTLTIGNSGKTFDGSTDVSWSLSEIGAASQSDLDILNSNLSVVDYTSSLNKNDEDISKIWELHLHKVGSIAVFVVNVSVTELGRTKYIGTLQEGIRPAHDISYNTVTNKGDPCYFFVDANGSFGITKIGADFNENDGVRFCAAYVI